MGKDKLRRFAEIATFSNVLELEEGQPFKGSWSKDHFKNSHPVVLELACGKGEYTVNLAQLFLQKISSGLIIKATGYGAVQKPPWKNGVNNVAFLRIQIESLLDYFGPNEIDEIWITFPDPQPQLSREKKRLTSPRFLEMYRQVLKPGGFVNLKTDNNDFYIYTADKINEFGLNLHINTTDLYRSKYVDDVLSIKTYYEKKYLQHNKNINYLKFSF